MASSLMHTERWWKGKASSERWKAFCLKLRSQVSFHCSFDPHFNAITGLNGSGKSNILDSICFVLGITNLSQVRAGNLSELVYKQGQAGVEAVSES